MHKDEPPTDDEDPLEDYCTDDILHDYRMLLQDYGPDDDLVKEMRAILVSRHRYLSLEETGVVSHNWQGAHCDTTQYHISANLIFEVDRSLFNFYGSIDGCLRQQVPIGKDMVTSDTVYQYLIGFQINIEDLPQHSFCIEKDRAMEIIDRLLSNHGGPNER